GRLRLHALVADRGELAQLIGHAAALPAHAIGAGLAGILGRQRLGRLAHPHAGNGGQRIKHLLGPAPHDPAGFRHLTHSCFAYSRRAWGRKQAYFPSGATRISRPLSSSVTRYIAPSGPTRTSRIRPNCPANSRSSPIMASPSISSRTS